MVTLGVFAFLFGPPLLVVQMLHVLCNVRDLNEMIFFCPRALRNENTAVLHGAIVQSEESNMQCDDKGVLHEPIQVVAGTRTPEKQSDDMLRGVGARMWGLHLSVDFSVFQFGDELMLRQVTYCRNKCSLLIVAAIMMSAMLVFVVAMFLALMFD